MAGAAYVSRASLGASLPSSRTALTVLAIVLVGLLIMQLNPVGFSGGASDDEKYLQAATDWYRHGYLLGTQHWQLRHTLVVPAALLFGLSGGVSIDALLAVPMIYYAALLAITFLALDRHLGRRVALIGVGLVMVSPLIQTLATQAYPDIIELFFLVGSLAAFINGCGGTVTPTVRRNWFAIAGLAASLALITRETSAYLLLIYAALFVAGRPVARREMLWIAAGAAPLLLGETLWLWSATGDWLYRAHVAMHHVEVPSTHMAGSVDTSGRVFFNGALAAKWTVEGPVNVHWAVNPIIYFFIDKLYGGLFWLMPVALIAYFATPGARSPDNDRRLLMLTVLSAISFVFLTYVLMVSQRPRYYAVPIYCGALILAIIADRLLTLKRFRAAIAALGAVYVVACLAMVVFVTPRDGLTRLALPLIIETPGTIHVDPRLAGQLAAPLALRSMSGKISLEPAPVGGAAIHVARRSGKPYGPSLQPVCCWRVERVAISYGASAVFFERIERLLGRPGLFGTSARPKWMLSLRRRIA